MCVHLKADEPGSVVRAACIAKSGLYGSGYCLACCKLDGIRKDCVCNRAYSKLAQSTKGRYSPGDVRETVGYPVRLAFNRTVCNDTGNDWYFRLEGRK